MRLYETNIRFWNREILGSKEQYGGKLSAFSFYLLYPRLKIGGAGSSKMQMGTDQKKKKKRPRKRQKTFRQ